MFITKNICTAHTYEMMARFSVPFTEGHYYGRNEESKHETGL